MQTRQLINEGGVEGKYFTVAPEAASDYARQAVRAFGDQPYTMVSTDIAEDLIAPGMRATVDGGIPAVVIPDGLLPSLTPHVHSSMVIPAR